MCIWNDEVMVNEMKKLAEPFDVDNISKMEENMRCNIKLNHEKQSMIFTQPVLLKSLPTTPFSPDMVLTRMDPGMALSPEKQTKYWPGVRELLHMMHCSCPDIYNSVHELAKNMTCK